MLNGKRGIFLCAGLILAILLPGVCIGCPLPEIDNGWYTGGDAIVDEAGVSLGDNNAESSYAYRYENKNRGLYKISFDFKNALSQIPYRPQGSDFAFFDTFYASLYFVDSCCRFDLENCRFCYAIPLFDLDFNGPSDIFGEIGESSLGQGWQHFETVFRNDFQKIIPTFELFEHNFINDDSEVLIANLSISEVPIPSTIFLLIGGLVPLLIRKAKKSYPSRM